MSDSLQSHGLQHTRLPCPSPVLRAYSNSCPLHQWCRPTISSSVIPIVSHLQSFPASGSFPVSWFFASGGQSIKVSALASVLPMNIQDWFPLASRPGSKPAPPTLKSKFSTTGSPGKFLFKTFLDHVMCWRMFLLTSESQLLNLQKFCKLVVKHSYHKKLSYRNFQLNKLY